MIINFDTREDEHAVPITIADALINYYMKDGMDCVYPEYYENVWKDNLINLEEIAKHLLVYVEGRHKAIEIGENK